MKKEMAIFGVGSSFGEDNVGEIVVGELGKKISRHSMRKKIKFDFYNRPGLYLLELMQGFKTVHLIDAMVSNRPIGTIHRYENIEMFQESNQMLSSHGFGLAETLALGETLACLPDIIIIHGIEINPEIKVEGMSEEVTKSSNLLVDIIAKEIGYVC